MLVCESGNIYSFKVTEDRELRARSRRLHRLPRSDAIDESPPGSTKPVLHEPKYVSRMDIAVYQEAAKQIRRERPLGLGSVPKHRMQAAIDQFRSTYPTLIRFEYRLDKKAVNSPFRIAGMWHDGRFTYVRSSCHRSPGIV